MQDQPIDEDYEDAPSWFVPELAPFYGMTETELHEAGRCAELVPVVTEDGPSDGRCLGPVVPGGYACEGHTAEIEGWRAMSEIERADWERRHDLFEEGVSSAYYQQWGQ